MGARTVAEVNAVRDNILYAAGRGFTPEFAQGILAAYRWVLGEAPAPISGHAPQGCPDTAVLREEDEAASQQLRFARDRARSRDYVNGVQHALMWTRGETNDQPWPMWDQS